MHLNLTITMQSQKVLKNWYYAKSKIVFDSDFNVSMIDLGRMANLKLVDKRGKELVELKLQVLA